MATGNEVTAIRLLSDERDLGIIEAQKYARSLVAGPEKTRSTEPPPIDPASTEVRGRRGGVPVRRFCRVRRVDLRHRRDENVWASGWVDKPEPEDRTDIDELWQTVQNAGRPSPRPTDDEARVRPIDPQSQPADPPTASTGSGGARGVDR